MHKLSMFGALGFALGLLACGSTDAEDTSTPSALEGATSSCSGASLTRAAAARLMPTGATQAKVGTWTIASKRERRCNEITGCGEWAPSNGKLIAGAGSHPGPGRNVPLASHGDVHLIVRSIRGQQALVFELRSAVLDWESSAEHISGEATYACPLPPVDQAFRTCSPGEGYVQSSVSGSERLGGWAFEKANFFVQGESAETHLKDHCARFVAKGIGENPQGEGNIEYEAVIEASY